MTDAIKEAVETLKHENGFSNGKWYSAVELSIKALEDYHPWIIVKERLPTVEDADEKGNVLTFDSQGMQEIFPFDEIESWNQAHYNQITHWKTSNPPKDGEK